MLLEHIAGPNDLKHLTSEQLYTVAEEVRARLIDCIPKTGGHFSPNLGVIELTVALLAAFDSPRDRLVWDVGHQAYAHKVLTGRNDRMETMRQLGGLCGFLAREESEHDAFGAGHTSTSISAALGMAAGIQLRGEPYHAVAIIGDGALTGGMAYEALNNAGHMTAPLIVVLNDNEMSISPSVGALNEYLTRLRAGDFYQSAKERVERLLRTLPQGEHLVELGKRAKDSFKEFAYHSMIWEELGFTYLGPIDGHDIDLMVEVFRRAQRIEPPIFIHVVTKKGKGFAPAEAAPLGYHAIAKLQPLGAAPKQDGGPKYSNVFGQWLCDMAERDPRLTGITPAMKEGSDLVAFSERFPERYFDVAIAEQHAVTLAAGMACEGAKPVVAIYSTFLQRAYDQLIHDVAVQNLDVLFAIDRAGLVGEDGPTHAGSFDLSYLRCIPGMLVITPSDENEMRRLLTTGYLFEGPAAVRYPRGSGPNAEIEPGLEPLEIGKGIVRRQGKGVAFLVFGVQVPEALQVAEKLDASVADMRFVKPLDEALVRQLVTSHELLVTIEENAVMGGAGSAVNEFLAREGLRVPVLNLGLPDYYVEHAKPAQMLAECGLDAAGIEAAVRERLAQLEPAQAKALP
jgi:1-deoxy-D-xylulose-5-phosphate synthase